MKSLIRHQKILSIVIVFILLLNTLPTSVAQAQGVIITVSTFADELNNNGLCSLREAIINANANAQTRSDCSSGFGDDLIKFIPSLGGAETITLTSQLPNISNTTGLTIDGENFVTISGGGWYRAFYVNEVTPLTLQNIIITNTTHSHEGGAIYNAGELTISHVTFYNNSASYQGGAIYQNGAVGSSLYIENSTFDDNFAGTRGGAISIEGGTVNIHNSTFINNEVLMTSSGTAGGAVYTASGNMNIYRSTFYSNDAFYGGALFTHSTNHIVNSTFAENVAINGGAMTIDGLTPTNIYNSTIAHNNSFPSGSGGLFIIGNPQVTLYNTIIANNLGFDDCSSGAVKAVAGNNNLIETMNVSYSCDLVNGVNGNIIGSDPKLELMVFAPTYYYPLRIDSPALNAGSGCEVIDQRNISRPQLGGCDIGSYEKTATFADVPYNAFAWAHIESIYATGITGGCSSNPLNYCPNNSVTRAQMAVFLLRGIHDASYTPPPATGTVFNDVPANSFAAAWIEAFSTQGITGGCGGGNYCPNSSITRAQMAIFLLRAKYGSNYMPPPPTGAYYFDVPIDGFATSWIETLSVEGITGGCGGGNYCPNNPVTRAQMAIFIQRTFNLPIP